VFVRNRRRLKWHHEINIVEALRDATKH
jgi:hypothetical protein